MVVVDLRLIGLRVHRSGFRGGDVDLFVDIDVDVDVLRVVVVVASRVGRVELVGTVSGGRFGRLLAGRHHHDGQVFRHQLVERLLKGPLLLARLPVHIHGELGRRAERLATEEAARIGDCNVGGFCRQSHRLEQRSSERILQHHVMIVEGALVDEISQKSREPPRALSAYLRYSHRAVVLLLGLLVPEDCAENGLEGVGHFGLDESALGLLEESA